MNNEKGASETVPTAALYELAEREGIELFFDLDHEDLLGLYHHEDDSTLITFRRGLEQRPPLFREVFAEELGHHFTSGGVSVFRERYADQIVHDRAEYRARAWGALFLMPTLELIKSFRECETVYSLAERFDAPENLVQFRLDVFKRHEILPLTG